VKIAVFDELEQVIRADIPLTTNTSAIPISLMQRSRKHPQRFAGMHWAGPAHVSRFVEVIRGDQTSDAVIDAVMCLAQHAGKDPALVKCDIEGFIVNRLCYAMYREALHLVDIGAADVESIDRCWRNVVGMWAAIAGPFRWMDLTGTALYAAGMRRIFPTLCNATDLPAIMKQFEASGAMGTSNLNGFYAYSEKEAQRWNDLLRAEGWRVRELQQKLFVQNPSGQMVHQKDVEDTEKRTKIDS
jgi:3-hydroxybutyryl-CoA dehydrogenase